MGARPALRPAKADDVPSAGHNRNTAVQVPCDASLPLSRNAMPRLFGQPMPAHVCERGIRPLRPVPDRAVEEAENHVLELGRPLDEDVVAGTEDRDQFSIREACQHSFGGGLPQHGL